MPGAAGMSMTGMVMGPRPAVALMLIAVVGPPTAIANVGTLSTKLGTMMGPMSGSVWM